MDRMHSLAENLAFMFGAGLLVLPVLAHGLGSWFYPLLFLGFLFGTEVSRLEVNSGPTYPFVLASYITGLALHLGVSPFLIFPFLLLPLGGMRESEALTVTVSLALAAFALAISLSSTPAQPQLAPASAPLFLFAAYFAFFTDNVGGEEWEVRKVALALSFVLYTLFTLSTMSPSLPTLATQLGRTFAVVLLGHSLLVVSGGRPGWRTALETLGLLILYQLLNLDFMFQVILGGIVITLLAMSRALKEKEWRLAALSALPLLAGALFA